MWRMRLAVAALAAAGLLTLTMASRAQEPAAAPEAPEDYPDHPGRDATFYFCTACHGFKVVAAQGLTREQWDVTLKTMTARHSMPDIQGALRVAMLNYLEAAFAPRRIPAGRQIPFAPK